MNIKEKIEQSKIWAEEHKTELIYGACTVGGVIVLGLIGVNRHKHGAPAIESVSEETVEKVTDLGRDCIMKFFVEETGEQIGKDILCTESFAMDMQDCL